MGRPRWSTKSLRFVPDRYLRGKIEVPTVAFAPLHDPIVDPPDFHRARKAFASDYTVEEVPGGHFLHREHPAIFAERLLAHL